MGGLAETILHKKTGLIVDLVDAKLLSESIELYFSAKLKFEFQEHIKLQNQANTWDNFGRKILKFYDDLRRC